MNGPDDKRLSQISTAWTVLFEAHDGPGDEVKEARRELLQRYSRAAYRYLLASVRDPDGADELYQEFALRVVRGDFRRARPDKGRFRDFLKTALYHLVIDYQRRRQRRPAPLPGDGPAVEESHESPSDAAFLAAWRAELLARAWEGLAGHERQTGQPLHTVLRLRTDQPDLTAAAMAERLAAGLGRTVDAGWVRKRLHFAREKFGELLVAEVEQTLDRPGADELVEELRELGWLDHCRAALKRG